MSAKEGVLTADEAIARLMPGDEVHCFMNPSAGVLLGADWAREDVIALLRRSTDVRETGPQAQAMKHGVAAWDGVGFCYFATVAARASERGPDGGGSCGRLG